MVNVWFSLLSRGAAFAFRQTVSKAFIAQRFGKAQVSVRLLPRVVTVAATLVFGVVASSNAGIGSHFFDAACISEGPDTGKPKFSTQAEFDAANEEYAHTIVHTYKHWELQVHGNQGALGRCVLVCRRYNAHDLAEATLEEREELFAILQEFRKVLMNVESALPFRCDWMNYAFLGNDFHHLHAHLIPRYNTPKRGLVYFAGMAIDDSKYWGKHFHTDKKFKTTQEQLLAVRDALRAAMPASVAA